MEIGGVDVAIDYIKERPELEDLVVNPSTEQQNFKSRKYGFKNVKVNAIKSNEVSITPSTEEQNIDGVFTKVTVNPIQSQELNATPTTEEQIITGLFDKVVVNAIEGQTLDINPSEELQSKEGVFLQVNINPIQTEEITTELDFSSGNTVELTAQEGIYIKKATINKDNNLLPENIKSGVSVCGIAGEVADTSDADATSADILEGKTAYIDNQKITGTLKVLDTSDATATAEDILEGKTAYVDSEKIVGTMKENSCNALIDIGTLTAPNAIYRKITKIEQLDISNVTNAQYMFFELNSLKEIPLLDTSNVTNMYEAFYNCKSLTTIPQLDTSNVTRMDYMFYGCSSLITIPLLDTSNVTQIHSMFSGCSSLTTIPLLDISNVINMSSMFSGCSQLSDESLNNILAMCTNAIKITNTNYKKLSYIGLTSSQATRCQSLSNYQAFLDAGWETGY